MPTHNQLGSLWFQVSSDQSVVRYELDVMQDGYQVGVTQLIDPSGAVNGEIEIQLSNVEALPLDAAGFYTFYVYVVDEFGRSELPFEVFNAELAFITNRLLPTNQNKVGVYSRNSTEPFFSGNYPLGDRS